MGWADDPVVLIEGAVEAKSPEDQTALTSSLVALAAIDRSFCVVAREGRTLIGARSETDLDRIVERLSRTSGAKMRLGNLQVAYRETIRKSVKVDYTHNRRRDDGREIARVKFAFEPNRYGEGFIFDNQSAAGTVPGTLLAAIMTGLSQGLVHQPLSSSAFETAARAALDEGLRQGRPVILEPIMRVEISVPAEFGTRIRADLLARRAIVEGQATREDRLAISALVPLANMLG